MTTKLTLNTLLVASGETRSQQLQFFALLTLGVVESLAQGLVSANDAIQVFFHAENCMFVRKQLRDKTADAIMSHGVQLADLFDACARAEAHREFQREVATMRTLCWKLLEEERRVA